MHRYGAPKRSSAMGSSLVIAPLSHSRLMPFGLANASARNRASVPSLRCTRIALVDPGIPGGLPATMTTRSPRATRPAPSNAWSTWRTISSVCLT